jgi:single-strand DNA-binding protein
MNRIDLIGRLTRDPELRKTETGHVRADFTIAVNRIGAKEEQQQADFIPCRVWGSQAENLTHFMGKGNQIAIEGNLRIDSYIDKDGNTKYTTYVLANRIEYLSSKKGEIKEESQEIEGNSIKMDELEITDDDLPF